MPDDPTPTTQPPPNEALLAALTTQGIDLTPERGGWVIRFIGAGLISAGLVGRGTTVQQAWDDLVAKLNAPPGVA